MLRAPLVIAALALSPFVSAAETRCTTVHRPIVEEVYPTGDILPNNLLRLYVYFSAPMQRGQTLEKVTLRSVSTGEPVDGVFFQSRYELWSDDGRRLTLLLDPGRVKTGLDANDGLGRALTEGEHYQLELGAALRGSNGCQLTGGLVKDFTAGPADIEAPSLAAWQLNPPRENTRDVVRLSLNGPHDHVSLAHRLRVKTDADQPVAGSIELAASETEWRFIPRSPWTAERYTIRIDPALEDVAGNRLTGLFDDPTGESRTLQSQTTSFELEFWPVR